MLCASCACLWLLFFSTAQSPLIREADDIVVTLDHACIEVRDKIHHREEQRVPVEARPELRRGGVAVAGIDERTNKHAVRVQRKRSDIAIEVLPIVWSHEKVLLDV